jgi:hypothetical protein
MSWFTGKQRKHKRGHKSSRIDPSTGRNKRDKVTKRATHGGPPRQIGTGKVVSRVQWRRDQKTRRRRSRLRSRNSRTATTTRGHDDNHGDSLTADQRHRDDAAAVHYPRSGHGHAARINPAAVVA